MAGQEADCAFLLVIHPDIEFIRQLPEAENNFQTATTLEATAQNKFWLKETSYKVGRDMLECQIIITAHRRDIRRVQAIIRRQDQRYYLEDNSSPYGTYVQGRRIEGAWALDKGEVIGFGATKEMLIFDEPEPGLEQPLNFINEKELEILKYLALGLTNKEIGSNLVVSSEAVKKRLNNVFQKLNVRNRTEAVMKAKTLGILPKY